MTEQQLPIMMSLLVLAISIPVHEFAHARSAVSYGDDTPRLQGRLTILPWDHFDLFGALMCVFTTITGFGFGWGKPVMINPANLRSPRWDGMRVAAWGPLSNLLMAIGAGLAIRFGLVAGNPRLLEFFRLFVIVNLALMAFNLIPIHPLDGSKILAAFLPDELAYRYERFMAQWGAPLFFALVFLGVQTGVMDVLVIQPVRTLAALIVGPLLWS